MTACVYACVLRRLNESLLKPQKSSNEDNIKITFTNNCLSNNADSLPFFFTPFYDILHVECHFRGRVISNEIGIQPGKYLGGT